MYCKQVNLLHDNLSIEGNNLCFAGYDTVELAKIYGTPLMLLDEQRIRSTMRTYKNAMEKYFGNGARPLYASKALSFVGIYQIAKEEGICTDIVSLGELYTAKKAGFPLENAFFHGNCKTDYGEFLFADLFDNEACERNHQRHGGIGENGEHRHDKPRLLKIVLENVDCCGAEIH